MKLNPKKIKPITLSIYINVQSIYSDGLNLCTVEITPKLYRWIKRMNSLVKKEKLQNVSVSNEDPTLLMKDGDTIELWDGGWDYLKLSIDKDSFHWEGCIKDTYELFESDIITIKRFERLLLIQQMPLKQIPKYINDGDPNVKELALTRLKETNQ